LIAVYKKGKTVIFSPGVHGLKFEYYR